MSFLNALFKKYPTTFPFVFLALAVLIPYWKLTTMQGVLITDDIFTSDIMNDSFPYRHYLGVLLRGGELPLWYPHIFGGIPFLARAEAGAAYPPNILLFGLLPPYVALNLSILLTLVISAIGMYLLVRELTGSEAGALLAAVAFAYSGFMVSHLKHMSNVGTVCWFPLGLWIIERAVKHNDGRRFLWLALVFGAQNLSGHIQTAYYSGLGYLAFGTFRTLMVDKPALGSKRRKGDSQPSSGVASRQQVILLALWFLAALTLGTGIAALQLLPTYEMVQLSQRSGGVSFEYAANYAYDPANIVGFLFPYANGDISDATYRGKSIFWEDYGYVGFVTLLLAILGAVKSWRRPHVKFFAGAAVAAYILVLGPNTPIYEVVFNVVPGMKYFRFPTRFMFVVNVMLCVLAAYGLTGFLSYFKPDRKQQPPAVGITPLQLAVLALVLFDLVYIQMRQNAIVDADKWREMPKTVAKLKEDQSLYRIFSPGASEVHKAIFNLAKGWSGDLQPYIDQREFIQTSTNVLYGLSSADGYAQLTPNYIVDIWGDQNRGGVIMKTAGLQRGQFIPTASFTRMMSLFNVKYLLSAWPITTGGFEEMDRLRGVFMYRNPSVQARAFVVGKYRVVAGSESAQAVLLSDNFDPGSEVIVYKRPQLDAQNDSLVWSAEIQSYRSSEVVMRVSTDKQAMLVFSDSYYPGWRAEVDGVGTEIYQANICQRAVVVPAGVHAVRFVFTSSPVTVGFGIAVVSLLATIVGLVVVRRGKAGEKSDSN